MPLFLIRQLYLSTVTKYFLWHGTTKSALNCEIARKNNTQTHELKRPENEDHLLRKTTYLWSRGRFSFRGFTCLITIVIFTLSSWEQKLPKSKSALESTWLYHEIGRCHLELGNNQEAKDYGEKSLAAAQEASDKGWQLHATVLIAQAEGMTFRSRSIFIVTVCRL